MAHDVFISYSTHDSNVANAIANALESNGARCWIAPRDIKPGEIWAGAIMNAITGSRVQVVVFSASANGSKDVHNEVDAAIRKGLIVIPFRIEAVSPDGAMEYHLRTRHWLDAMTPDLESGIRRLVADVKAILSGDSKQSQRIEPPIPAPAPQIDSKVSIRIPRLSVLLARLWRRQKKVILGLAAVLGLTAAGWFALHQRTVSGVRFSVSTPGPDGRDEVLSIVERGMRFYEAGTAPTPLRNRVYLTKLPAATTRYVKIELNLDHPRPNRVVPLPIACTIFKPTGAVHATLAQNVRIQPEWEGTYYVLDWGSAVPGTWSPGKYRVDCSYGGTLIGRDHFEITGDPALAKAPPEIPALNARVMSVKFFESGAGALPEQSRRIYADRFEARTARHINVELLTNHAAAGREVQVAMGCTFTKPDGSTLYATQNNFKVPPTYENTSFATGTGWAVPGNWLPGSYKVACTHEGRTIAQGGFEIIGQ